MMLTLSTTDGPRATTARLPDTTPIVYVIEDDAVEREALELLVETSGWRCQAFASARSFLDRPRARVPSCVVLDVTLPGCNGLEVQQRLAVDGPGTSVVFITGRADVAITVQAMKAGAVEFLMKPFHDDELVGAIEHALARARRAVERQAQLSELFERYQSLTPREREVMVLVVSGLLNKQVGGELGISEITVKAHRGQVMRKMKADSLPALVHMVSSLGLVGTPFA